MNGAEKPFRIGGVVIPNRLVLAPMAGYTDVAMRELCAESGAGLTVTEMVSAKGLAYNPRKCEGLLLAAPSEGVKCVQLFGHEPEFFEKAVSSDLLAPFDIIDINMGCPVPKIVRNGEGSALLKNPKLAGEIVAACVRAANGRPVTVKTRLGFDEGEFTAVEFCRRMEGEGAAAITLHGRTRAQGYSGLADRDKIATVKETVGIPLIGNGDVNAATVDDMLSRTDAAAVGRAAVGNPYIFAQILGKPVRESVRDLVLRHIELSYRYYGDRYTFVNIRKHLGAYLGGVRGGKEIRIKLFSATSVEELVELVKLYFPSDER